jgi:Uma2 family endonuclease
MVNMALPVSARRRLFTTEEYEQMIRAGILREDDRVELLRGEILEMAPIGLRHSACVSRLSKLLERTVGERAIVWVQNPVLLPDHSMPQPDVTLLRWRDDFYARSRPIPQDVLLLVEVADTSLVLDRTAKVPLYAQAGIPEMWLVNLIEDTIEVYRQPQGQQYARVSTVGRGQSLAFALPGMPEVSLRVDDILGTNG